MSDRQDNAHCFKGMGQIIWRDRARGLQPLDTISGPQGHRVAYQTDPNDGFAMQNGGIAIPRIAFLPNRLLIRFIRSGLPPKARCAGNWWLDLDTYAVLSGYAHNHRLTLAQAAGRLLVLPLEWSDCSAMVVARPCAGLQCYKGKGKPVALSAGRDISPDGKRQPGTRLYDAPQGTNLEQIYIPGERQFLPNWLTEISTHAADAGPSANPPL